MSMTEQQFIYINHFGQLLMERFPITFSVDVAIFIGCQFALESNYGMSNLAIMHNNHCGMKVAHNRMTTQLPFEGEQVFGHYSSLTSCVVDYLLCLEYRKITKSCTKNLEKFKKFIDGWYCPEPTYIQRIEQIHFNFKQYGNSKS